MLFYIVNVYYLSISSCSSHTHICLNLLIEYIWDHFWIISYVLVLFYLTYLVWSAIILSIYEQLFCWWCWLFNSMSSGFFLHVLKLLQTLKRTIFRNWSYFGASCIWKAYFSVTIEGIPFLVTNHCMLFSRVIK